MIKSNFFMRHKKLLIILGFILIVAIIGGRFFVIGGKKATLANQQMIQEFTSVEKGNIELTVTGSGAIESSSTKDVAAEVSAKVKAVNIKVGDIVKKGDILFELDSSDLETQIRNKQKTVTNYQKTVNEYNEDIKNLNVYSDVSGYIKNLTIDKGDEVNKNSKIFEIVDDSYYVFTTNFRYNSNNPIEIGDTVTMMINESFEHMEGTVSKVSDFKEHYEYGGEMQEVEVKVENPGYTLEGITVSQIAITTKNNLMAISTATFEGLESVSFKCPTSGTVAQLNVNEGSYVTPDTLIMTLENEDLYENLSDAKNSLSDALTELSDIKEDYSFYTITAPIDGVVTSVDVNVDDYVRSESTIAKIVNNTEVKFEISVDELDILDIEIGQEAKVTIDALEETETTPLIGHVTEIALEGTNMNSVTSYPVTISLAGSDEIRMGMNCTTEIVVDSAKDVLVIPVEAVEARRNKYYVTMEDDTQREIEIGIYDEDYIEIVSGLTEGEKVKLPTKILSTSTGNETTEEGGNMMGGFMGGSAMPMGGSMPTGMTGGMPGGMTAGGMRGGR